MTIDRAEATQNSTDDRMEHLLDRAGLLRPYILPERARSLLIEIVTPQES